MSKKVAIVLCGCGAKDGSEIHEAVLTLLHVFKKGGTPLMFSPSGAQERVVNHLSGLPDNIERNMLEESARIARGDIHDLKELSEVTADALIFPGGFGAAFNLCNFAKKGAGCSVHPEVERVINEFFVAKKPLGFICIAPTFAAKVLGFSGVELTIGNDASTASEIEKMGARHFQHKVDEIHVDKTNKIVSTPAYMLAKNIAEVESGISKLVDAVIMMA